MKHKLTVQAEILTDARNTWERYTKPEHIVKWNFASDDWHCPSATNELHVGGAMNWRMEAKDGSFGFDFEAVYDEVVEEKKLAYTMPDGRQVSVDFEPAADVTRVAVSFDPEDQNPLEMQQEGWQAILNNFKKYAESI